MQPKPNPMPKCVFFLSYCTYKTHFGIGSGFWLHTRILKGYYPIQDLGIDGGRDLIETESKVSQ